MKLRGPEPPYLLLEILYLAALIAVASLAWEAGYRQCAWHVEPGLLTR